MKNYKRTLSFGLLAIMIFPSITFAAWWNPFTWNIFQKKEVMPVVQVLPEEEVELSEVESEGLEEVHLDKDDDISINKEREELALVHNDPDLVTDTDSWQMYSQSLKRMTYVPPYQERLKRAQEICNYIERTVKPLFVSLVQYPYCSIGLHPDILSGGQITYLDFINSSRKSKSNVNSSWEIILDFETNIKTDFDKKILELAQQISSQHRNTSDSSFSVDPSASLGDRIRSRMNSSSDFEYSIDDRASSNSNSNFYSSLSSGVDCSRYQSEKSALDQKHSQNGTLFSSSRSSEMNALELKYAECF